MDKRIIFVIIAVLLGITTFIIIHKLKKKEKIEISYLIKNIKLNKAPIDSAIYFEDNTENATSWKWNFGDDQYSFEKAPNHIYTKAGKYRISLTVSGPFGDIQDTSKEINVTTIVADTSHNFITTETPKPAIVETPKPIEKKEPAVAINKPAPIQKPKAPAPIQKPKVAHPKSNPVSPAKEVQIAPTGYERIEK
jgi:PKD repeat protein